MTQQNLLPFVSKSPLPTMTQQKRSCAGRGGPGKRKSLLSIPLAPLGKQKWFGQQGGGGGVWAARAENKDKPQLRLPAPA